MKPLKTFLYIFDIIFLLQVLFLNFIYLLIIIIIIFFGGGLQALNDDA